MAVLRSDIYNEIPNEIPKEIYTCRNRDKRSPGYMSGKYGNRKTEK